MDRIHIKNLEIYCHHGVLKEENVLGQKFLVSADLYTDIKKAGSTDDITYSINYAEVSHFIKEYMKDHTYKLIESVAEHLSEQLLLRFPLIRKISLTVKKPWAPILLPIDTVSVEIERGWHRSYLSIGSNMGDKERHIKSALTLMEKDKKIKVKQCSELIVTEPYGDVEQDDFLNGAVEIDTLYTPQELLEKLHQIEQEGGRKRTVRWGPRTIDIDILLYDDEIISEENLIIPHREMHLRAFVLNPLASIAPWVRHPVLGQTILVLQGGLQRD